MEWMAKKNVLIVGLGLMGGSYARALKRLGYHVAALDRDEDSIAYALQEHIISEGAAGTDERMIREADAIIFALYPGIFPDWVRDHQHLFKSGAFMTDVTGVKSCIVYRIQELLREDVEFIAAHPWLGGSSAACGTATTGSSGTPTISLSRRKRTRQKALNGAACSDGCWAAERSPCCPRRNTTG